MLKDIKMFDYNRKKYENILDDPNSKLWRFLSNFITFLIILFSILISFESIGNNYEIYYKELFLFDAFISIVFFLEYLYRFVRARDKKEFLINPTRIIDLLSFLPFFLWLVAIWDFLKTLRLLRILRVLRLIREIPLTAWFVKSLKEYKDEYKAVFILFLIILFIWSSFVYFIENNVDGTHFTSIPASVWWGLVTMTTVWYGDIVPMTSLWKIISSILVFIWPLILALASAITIMVFMESAKKHEMTTASRRWKKCDRCDFKNPNTANYCMECWRKYK